MAVINQVVVEVLNVVQRGLQERDTTSSSLTPTSTPSSAPSSTSASPSSSTTSSGGSSGPTSSPLLFFVALGFGVVFTNLWIIVGVKYCFRYNARNRARRNGEEVDPINLDNMPTRPHRRRREKKLMSMEEVNVRFPLTKYKTWVATRAIEGLPTAGGVTAPTNSRPGSAMDAEGVATASPPVVVVERQEEEDASGEIATSTPTHTTSETMEERKSMNVNVGTIEKGPASPSVEERNPLETVQTTASTVDKQATATSEEEDEEDEDQILTAVAPELLSSPGDSCAICIDTLEEDDDVRGLTCGHAFHAGCLDPWLTSRRACCPLCKADYYTPKPRPEGEAADAERAAARSSRMPQQPSATWTGVRGGPRSILAGRFMTPPGDATTGHNRGPDRAARRAARREAAQAAAQPDATATAAAAEMVENTEQRSTNRWRPNMSNPLRNLRMPGRARRASTVTAGGPSPSQLESGIVR